MSSKPTEVRAFGAQLLAASKLIGKYCDDVNDEFILCKAEHDNPVHCVKIGRKVTECALQVYVADIRLMASDSGCFMSVRVRRRLFFVTRSLVSKDLDYLATLPEETYAIT